jgi:hypothetical protein
MTTSIGTPPVSALSWRKSSHSLPNNDCVETARLGKAAAVRDSKRPEPPAPARPAAAWQACLDFLKR